MIDISLLLADLPTIITWWAIIFLIGVIFLPITFFFFSSLIDHGYLFSKVLGITLISYVSMIGGVTHTIPFSSTTVFLIVLFFIFCNIFISKRISKIDLRQHLPLFLSQELIFFVCLVLWSYIRGFQPDIHGLEKYMDFGFVNSILRSTYFPPYDMWFAPFTINYYYFGHLYTAVLTKLSFLPPEKTYNLMIATLFSFTFSLSFSLGSNLIYDAFKLAKNTVTKRVRLYLLTGLIVGFLVALSGNMHTLYSLFQPYNTDNPVSFTKLAFLPQSFPNGYWYPNATRFIYNTIHEFPLYSFVVSDLHGHVLDIPIVLTLLAIAFIIIKNLNVTKPLIGLSSFLIAIAYMTNVWDSLIYLFVIGCSIFYVQIKNHKTENTFIEPLLRSLKSIFAIFFIFLIFALPFSIHFKPFVSGIGVLCSPSALTSVGKIGPFIFEANHCQRSPIWQLAILYGFFYMWVAVFILYSLRTKKLSPSDVFVLILIAIATILILIPELIYIKDIYPAHYRANTMFKLVYQSFIILSICSGYILIRLTFQIKQRVVGLKKKAAILICMIIACYPILTVGVYPYFAIMSYYGNLQKYSGLNGISYLLNSYPSDYKGIQWIKENIHGQPVILEAQGDSYTDFARVSSNTGLPTVLGWTVHEWLWRGTYDIPSPRITDVKTLYETTDEKETRQLINKYDISYVFVGDLEKQKYSVNEQKFIRLGKTVYTNGKTTIYKISKN